MRIQARAQYLDTLRTPLGWVALLASERGLLAASLPCAERERAVAQLWPHGAEAAALSSAPFGDLPQRLQAYCSGRRVALDAPLDLSDATPFQRRVWQATCLIPHGQTRSYGWVARALGHPGAARAVGRALGQNRLPMVVPCHRVIGGDGALGGYTGGVDLKRRLLELERVSMFSPK